MNLEQSSSLHASISAKRPSFVSALVLPNGTRIKNRFFKSAMSEQLGDGKRNPKASLATLYGTWAQGGIGLQVTGNVMIDRRALGEPKNVVLDEQSDLAAFERWATAARAHGTHVWVQLNHPGKQVPIVLSRQPLAPSAIPLEGPIAKGFAPPRAMTEAEIEETIARFATSATLAKKAGFTGVQIHGAHGYLVSQFLSPRHNQREDRWGGSPENRRRFVLEVYRAIRAAVGPDFPVGIKLNSADFQRGGFTEEESMDVVEALAAAGIDLIEVSGGTYEAPVAVTGAKPTERTRQREAYFLEYAEKVRARVSIPIVVTGGFRSGKAMKEALQSGAMDMIGLARTLAVQPDLPNRLFAQEDYTVELPRPTTGIKALDLASMLDITWYEAQLERIGSGRPVKADLCPWVAVGQSFARMGLHAFRPRRA